MARLPADSMSLGLGLRLRALRDCDGNRYKRRRTLESLGSGSAQTSEQSLMGKCVQAFTPIVTMLALFLAQMESPTARLISAVCVIAVGTAVASYGEVHLSALGVIFMFSSEAFEAIRLVMTQMLLVGLKLHPSTPFLCVLLVPSST